MCEQPQLTPATRRLLSPLNSCVGSVCTTLEQDQCRDFLHNTLLYEIRKPTQHNTPTAHTHMAAVIHTLHTQHHTCHGQIDAFLFVFGTNPSPKKFRQDDTCNKSLLRTHAASQREHHHHTPYTPHVSMSGQQRLPAFTYQI